MKNKNSMTVTFSSLPVNEAFARMAVSAFIMPLDPTVSEITDIKTAVSEAVTNSIIHGYDGLSGDIVLLCSYEGREIYIEISDRGRGIADIKTAMTPLYTSRPELERSGLGFTVMETFMDSLKVESLPGEGTKVIMSKKLSDGE
ncbi:MAG TPA: anti-sigma F factor [Firmicutes bacterium]|nr:anti-sigma F factor [Bacillota bacterium]